MARGDTSAFHKWKDDLYNGIYDITSDTLKWTLVTSLPVETQTTPTLSDFTEVAGSGFTAGGQAAVITTTESGGVKTLSMTNSIVWSKNDSGPTNIMAAILYNSTKADQAMLFIDMSSDSGVTPVSLQNGQISISPPAGGIFYKSVI